MDTGHGITWMNHKQGQKQFNVAFAMEQGKTMTIVHRNVYYPAAYSNIAGMVSQIRPEETGTLCGGFRSIFWDFCGTAHGPVSCRNCLKILKAETEHKCNCRYCDKKK